MVAAHGGEIRTAAGSALKFIKRPANCKPPLLLREARKEKKREKEGERAFKFIMPITALIKS